jgi:tetratricopeptide (TPR) repeat protein
MMIRIMAVYCVLTWTGILPSCAQQSASTSIAASASQLPVDAQATLDQLQANLKAVRAAGDAAGEARILNNIGSVYSALGEHQKALEFYNQALPIRRAVGDRGGEAAILNNIAAVYSALGEKQKALDFFNQALPIGRAVGDRGGEATTLSNIGAVYSSLGEQQKALDFYNQALPVFRAVGDRGSEATILNNIGLVYDDLGEKQKSAGLLQPGAADPPSGGRPWQRGNHSEQYRRCLLRSGRAAEGAGLLQLIGATDRASGRRPRRRGCHSEQHRRCLLLIWASSRKGAGLLHPGAADLGARWATVAARQPL